MTKNFYIGITGGYCRSINTYKIRLLCTELCGYYPYSTGNGYNIGIKSEYTLSKGSIFNFSVSTELLYEVLSSEVTKEGGEYYDTCGNIYPPKRIATQGRLEITYSQISWDLLFQIALTNIGIGLCVGPNLSIPTNKNKKEFYEIVNPEGAIFSRCMLDDLKAMGVNYMYENDRRLIIIDSNNPNYNNIRIGLTYGLYYNIDLGFMKIEPWIFYDHAFTKLSDKYDWYIYNFKAGMSILFLL